MQITINLTQAQLTKMRTGQTFQLSPSSFEASGRAEVAIKFHSKVDYNKFMKNMKANKGFRFNEAMYQIMSSAIEGGKLANKIIKDVKKRTKNINLDDIENYVNDDIEGGKFSFKKLKKTVKKTANKGIKTLKKQANKQMSKAKKRVKREARKAVYEIGDDLADEFQDQTGFDVRDKGQSIKQLKKYGKQVANKLVAETINNGAAVAATHVTGNPGAGVIASQIADRYVTKNINKAINKKIDGAGFIKSIHGGGVGLFSEPKARTNTVIQPNHNRTGPKEKKKIKRDLNANIAGNMFVNARRGENVVVGGSFRGGSFRGGSFRGGSFRGGSFMQ